MAYGPHPAKAALDMTPARSLSERCCKKNKSQTRNPKTQDSGLGFSGFRVSSFRVLVFHDTRSFDVAGQIPSKGGTGHSASEVVVGEGCGRAPQHSAARAQHPPWLGFWCYVVSLFRDSGSGFRVQG